MKEGTDIILVTHLLVNEEKKGDVGMAKRFTETRDGLSTTLYLQMSGCLSAPDATSPHHYLQNHREYFTILS